MWKGVLVAVAAVAGAETAGAATIVAQFTGTVFDSLDPGGYFHGTSDDPGANDGLAFTLAYSLDTAVLSRDGEPATGSPWVVDSLDVAHDESYEVAFVADNPGLWMDHCHNLPHAADGLVAHLAYDGVSTPYRVGGDAGNQPE